MKGAPAVDQIYLVELDDGFTCYSPSPNDSEQFSELKLIYSEIFTRRSYLREDMCLGEEPFVVDVGGNVGLFTLFVAATWPKARILAFEPIPCLGAAFRRNLELHEVTGATLVPVGLGRAPQNGVTFTYYPVIPGSSTRYPEQKKPHQDLLARVMGKAVADYAFAGETVVSDVERLSDVLARHGRTGPIDLLKVDTEGAELDILCGIDDRDWQRIRHVVLEVHDLEGRLTAVNDLLYAKGFEVSSELNTELPEGFDTYLVWGSKDWPDRVA